MINPNESGGTGVRGDFMDHTFPIWAAGNVLVPDVVNKSLFNYERVQ